MNRPTIALACILKNEVENLPRLLKSVDGCFDKIYLSDTGSDDGTVELINSYIQSGINPSNTPIYLQQFEWPNNFGEARTKSFEPVKEDYVMWIDLDDVLSDKDAFIEWRNTIMNIADFWVATYHYASNAEGQPVVSFARERVVKRSYNFKWKYFVHEGMSPESKLPVTIQYATSWSVVHKRTEDDMKKDKSRNLLLFEKNKDGINGRMLYYWGKELFENNQPLEAIQKLFQAIEDKTVEGHDRIMAIQYACLCAMRLNELEKAIALAHNGLQLDPNRAEFYVAIGDCYAKLNQPRNSIPFYITAANCHHDEGSKIKGPMFSHKESYTTYPHLQLCRIYVHLGDLEKAKAHLKIAMGYTITQEMVDLERELIKVEPNAHLPEINLCKHTDDIIITGLPVGPYEWDEEIYKTKGIGGSETAAVEMARHLHNLTGRNVLVFNNRTEEKDFGGVKYLPAANLMKLAGDKIPKAHIAWRHNIKLSHAPTYLWCHDLYAPGIDHHANYEKVLALSEFHKNFLKVLHSVPEEKIIVTSNGINLEKFASLDTSSKEGQRVVFSSSPDRGLDRAMRVMDQVVKFLPKAELHAYYGFDNMYKAGRNAEADKIKAMASERPYVHIHGNVEQKELYKELAKAKVWLYPTNFLETYCITALEMLACKVFPIVRDYGALPHTLKGCKEALLLGDCITQDEVDSYAKEVVHALGMDKWKMINYDLTPHSWQNVAKSWLEFLPL